MAEIEQTSNHQILLSSVPATAKHKDKNKNFFTLSLGPTTPVTSAFPLRLLDFDLGVHGRLEGQARHFAHRNNFVELALQL